jgi:hypothetical protein
METAAFKKTPGLMFRSINFPKCCGRVFRSWLSEHAVVFRRNTQDLGIGPPGVKANFRRSFQVAQGRALLANPTNGSLWMVQVQPTRTNSSLESHQRQLVDGSSPASAACLFPALVLLSAACKSPLLQF